MELLQSKIMELLQMAIAFAIVAKLSTVSTSFRGAAARLAPFAVLLWVVSAVSHIFGMATTYFILGLVLVVLGVPLVQRWVPRTGWYGYQIPKTLASDSMWYPANVIAGRDMVIAGALVAAFALGSMAFGRGIAPDDMRLANFFVFVLVMTGSLIHTYVAIEKLS